MNDRHSLYPNIPLVIQEQAPIKYQPGPEANYENYSTQGHIYQPLTCQPQTKFSKNQGAIVYPFNSALLSHHPTTIQCPQCQEKVITRVYRSCGCGTCLAIGGICLIGFFIPCVLLGCQLIPCCVDDCLDASHFCPSCEAHLGTKKCL